MAKFLSQVYTVIRGSVGGVTYLAGPHHALIARARVAPVNPGTQWQNSIRSYWAYAATLWQGLTDAIRHSWEQYAASVQFQSPTGPYSVGGRNLFTAWHAARHYFVQRGLAAWVTTAAPTTPGGLLQAAINSDSPLAAPGTGRILNVTNNNTGRISVYAELSPVQSSIRNFWKGPFDAGTVVVSNILAPAATASLVFTGLVEGGTYFARVGCMLTGVDLAGSVPLKVAPFTIYRFVATTTV